MKYSSPWPSPERDIPKHSGAFLRTWARPVNAPERSAAVRRSAFLAERGFTGRDRVRTLAAFRDGSVLVAGNALIWLLPLVLLLLN